MRIAALVKQVPAFEAMQLGPDGRLVREGIELEMNPYCRRAVAKGVELARTSGGTCTVITLGPPSAEDCLREAIAWGCHDGVLITGAEFAGSDTLATARTLAAALAVLGPFDLILAGRNSVDADTGQVGPQVAELVDVAFAAGVRTLALDGATALVQCEEDDGYSERTVALPALLSCAERLTDPAKVDPAGRAAVDPALIRTLTPADLGQGPWGTLASGTYVGETRVLDVERARERLHGPVDAQVKEAVERLAERGALDGSDDARPPVTSLAAARPTTGAPIAVAVEPGRPNVTRELLGAAHTLAVETDGHVVAVVSDAAGGFADADLGAWGADAIVAVEGAAVEEDIAAGLVNWLRESTPWAVLLPSTTWGREIGSRAAAAIGAGLTGDAIDLEVTAVASTGERQLLAWKPAFGGRLVAAIYCSTPVQMATVRAGVLVAPTPREGSSPPRTTVAVARRERVHVQSSTRDDDIDVLGHAEVVVGVGAAVPPDDYSVIEDLADALGAEIAATRKVTDKAWLPRARQVGITGRSIAPRLYVAVAMSGKFNHMVGVRAAGTIVAINDNTEAPIWEHCDIGIVGDWREVVPALTVAVTAALAAN